ncbi:hypothetical protein LguiA_018822 [Lonicera macranthoides]
MFKSIDQYESKVKDVEDELKRSLRLLPLSMDFAIINQFSALVLRDSEYVKKVYGGYFNVFVEAFGEEGERWDLFRVVEGEFPNKDDLQHYDGFVVSGSPYDAYANDSWILELCVLLQTLDSMQKKVLGICFGHQVSQVPMGAEVIAFSDKTGVEMFMIGDHILGIQGHPEYTNDILNNLIDRLLNNDCIEKGFAEEAKLMLEKAEPDRKCWQRICKGFLKGIFNP